MCQQNWTVFSKLVLCNVLLSILDMYACLDIFRWTMSHLQVLQRLWKYFYKYFQKSFLKVFFFYMCNELVKLYDDLLTFLILTPSSSDLYLGKLPNRTLWQATDQSEHLFSSHMPQPKLSLRVARSTSNSFFCDLWCHWEALPLWPTARFLVSKLTSSLWTPCWSRPCHCLPP